MADANPVDTTPAKAGRWTKLIRHRKLALTVGGSALLLAAGAYGYKHFTADPGKVVAQSDPAPVAAPARPEEPIKRPDPAPEKAAAADIPEVTVVSPLGRAPAVRPAEPDFPLVPPPPVPDVDVRAPAADKQKDTTTAGVDLPDLPLPPPPSPTDKPKPASNDPGRYTAPEGPRKPAAAGDFKAPADLPKLGPTLQTNDAADKKPDVKGPVITIGGMNPDIVAPAAPPTPKKDDPPVPNIDLVLPPMPPGPMIEKKDEPPPVVAPKADAGPKKDVPVINLPKAPKTEDLPPLPKIDLDPSTPPVPPAGPMSTAVAPVKKDAFDEDWHTPATGLPDYPAISREYYKSADYAQALAAYNRDRRERIVRVPPTWVLEERFGNLIRKAETPTPPDAPPAATVTFEPAAPVPAVPTARRPSPPAAVVPVGSSAPDEYKVTAPNGETIREVAQKVLGNPNAWRQLEKLNPDIDPTLPIPAGTSLRVPR